MPKTLDQLNSTASLTDTDLLLVQQSSNDFQTTVGGLKTSMRTENGSNLVLTSDNAVETSGNLQVGNHANISGNVEITGTGWAIFPNRTGLGTIPNLSDDTVQVTGGLAVEGGMKQMLGDGTITNVWYTSGTEDINIVRNFNNIATLMSMRSQASHPATGDDREATVALVRTDDSGNEEFLDLFNNGYHTVSEVEYGIRIQKRGTGEYRDFAIQYHDGTNPVEDVMRVNANDRSINFSNEVTITSKRVMTVTSGTTYPSNPGLGDECYRTDSSLWFKYNGSTWDQIS